MLLAGFELKIGLKRFKIKGKLQLIHLGIKKSPSENQVHLFILAVLA